jgi:CDP-diacylglycerol--serine O-phosphatidyltransferase
VGIVFALEGRSEAAFWLIAAASVADFADGFVARLTKQYSAIGRELDSLADMVSFGVAPSMVLFAEYDFAPETLPRMAGLGVFAVALFSALRLAKFNVDDTQRDEFSGLPTPAAALAIASLGWMCSRGMISAPREVILIMAGVVSVLLVSPLRMFSLKFKKFGWSGNELRWSFIVASGACFAVLGVGGIATAVGIYIVVSTVRHFAVGWRTKNI